MTADAPPDTPVDPDILAVLEYVSAGRGYVGVRPYPDFEARRALGRLHDTRSLRSEASGTPTATAVAMRISRAHGYLGTSIGEVTRP